MEMEIQTVQNAFSPHWSIVVKYREVHDLQHSPHLSHGTRTLRKKPWTVIVSLVHFYFQVSAKCMSESYTLRKRVQNLFLKRYTFVPFRY